MINNQINIGFVNTLLLKPLLIIGLLYISFEGFSQEKVLRFQHHTVDDGLPQNTIQGITKDKFGFMWFGTWEGLCRFDGYNFIVYKADKNNPKTMYNNRINFLYKDSNGDIWICGADTMISKYNYLSDDFTRFTHKQLPQWLIDSLDRYKNTSFTSVSTNNYSWTVYQQNNILTRKLQLNEINNLLTQTNKRTGKRFVYRLEPLNQWSLSDEYVYHMYLDNQEILWVGTYSGGINRADLRQKPFTNYSYKYNNTNCINDNMIRAFCEDNDGNLWVGTHNKGITKMNRNKDTYVYYEANKNNPNGLIHNMIRKIYRDRYGFIWIGTKGGADRFDSKTGRFKHFHFPSVVQMPKDWIYEFMEDHNGNLWIGTWTGIGKYDRKNERFHIYDPYKTLPRHSVRVILEDKNYNLWVATEGGLVKLKRDSSNGFIEKLTPTYYKFKADDPNSISDDRIYSMLLDEDNFIWLGTAKGLNRFDPKTGNFKQFGSAQGFPDEFIVGILSDMKGNLWISHKRGLTRFNKITFAVRNFTKNDGLQGNDFSENAYYRSPKTGEMFFGGNNGFNSFFPDSIKDNPYVPVIKFTQLKISNLPVGVNQKVNNRIILNKPLYMCSSIELTYNDKTFSIEFSALHFSSPLKNKYAYMLEGFDKDWVYTDATKREAVYSNLSSGKYLFKVRASNCDGIWNPEEKTIKIIIFPPWWRTWWFIICIIIFVFSVLYAISYFRERNYLKVQELLTFQVEARTKELKETNELLTEKQLLIQHQADELKETNSKLSLLNTTKDKLFSIIAHDLRNPFHLVIGFSELLLHKLEALPVEKTKKYIGSIHMASSSANDLLENLLHWSRSQTGRLSFEPELINPALVTDNVVRLLEGSAQYKNITIKQLIDPESIIFADENMLKTIVRNLISNAIKFTKEDGIITITLLNTDEYTEFVISDTGIGISSEDRNLLFQIDSGVITKGTSNESGTGIGLVLCKEFIDRHNGIIWVESELGNGSQFKFRLPFPSIIK